jgi:hypothetical protein
MLFSAEKGVTNDGTIVHCNRPGKDNRQETKEQLFTARRDREGRETAKEKRCRPRSGQGHRPLPA